MRALHGKRAAESWHRFVKHACRFDLIRAGGFQEKTNLIKILFRFRLSGVLANVLPTWGSNEKSNGQAGKFMNQ
jgi:hypothetical protein